MCADTGTCPGGSVCRPENSVRTTDVGNILCTVALHHIADDHILGRKHIYGLQSVCRDARCKYSARFYFKRWLRLYEYGCGSLHDSMRPLYLHYQAAILQRLYLKHVLRHNHITKVVEARESEKVVVLGSYPMARFMKAQLCCDWRPGDIDMFTLSENTLHKLADKYIERVLRPLDLGFRISYSCAYYEKLSNAVEILPNLNNCNIMECLARYGVPRLFSPVRVASEKQQC